MVDRRWRSVPAVPVGLAASRLLHAALASKALQARGLLEERRMDPHRGVLARDRAELREIVSPNGGQMLERQGVADRVPCDAGDDSTDRGLPDCIPRQGSPTRIHVFIRLVPRICR